MSDYEEEIPLHSGPESPTSRYRSQRRGSPTLLNRLLRPRTVVAILKFGLPALVLIVVLGLLYWEPHVEIAFYNRSWVKQEILTVTPLGGCFSPRAISPSYNATDALYGLRRTEVHAGTPLQFGMDCYDFAGTVVREQREAPAQALPGDQRVQYHTYWRTDLAPFGPRQEWMLKSFFATQDTSRSRLVLWSNGDLSQNEILQRWLKQYPDAFALKVVDYAQLARGTELQGSELLKVSDARAWIDGDLVRLLVIWAYGGVWIDMDSLLTRDLAPLLEHEFVTQWDCYGECSNYICVSSPPPLPPYHPYHPYLLRVHSNPPFCVQWLARCSGRILTECGPRQAVRSAEWRAHALPHALPLPV